MRPVARQLQLLNNRVFKRVTREGLREDFARLGLSSGDTVYAHVSLRSLGYATGGPAEVVDALLDVLGARGTLMMSAWPAPDPRLAKPGELFDVSETPSMAGRLSESLRGRAGAVRSLHPIASVAVLGARAEGLVEGHEVAATPFGAESPYGKLARLDHRLLLVGAHIGGLLYHVMDRVGFPNLYAPEQETFDVRDAQGAVHRLATLAPRADVPHVVILPGGRPENRDYLQVADYALMFPPERERRVMEAGYLRFNRSRFLGRRERLQARGMLRLGKVGASEAALLDGRKLLDQISKDLAWDIARFKDEYDPEQLSLLSLPSF